MEVSSAYKASCVLGEGCGVSEIQSANRVVDKTAPWGRPEGVVYFTILCSVISLNCNTLIYTHKFIISCSEYAQY
jgi:hypothetical protein